MRPAKSAFKAGVVGTAMKAEAVHEASGFQKLSNREGGQFDRKFHTADQKARIARGETIR